jgi:hypothetical protein
MMRPYTEQEKKTAAYDAITNKLFLLPKKVTVVEPGSMRTDWVESSMTFPPVGEP